MQGDAPALSADTLHEAVLFGSGDDFNGASAIADSVVMYGGITLSPNDAKKEDFSHALLCPQV